jgi:predicted kinase
MRFWHQVVGWWRTEQHLQQPDIRRSLISISDAVMAWSSPPSAPRTKRYIMLVGFSQSGKSELVQTHPLLSTYARITTQDLHDRLNARLVCLRDDTSIDGPTYWERQFLTRWLRRDIERRMLATGTSVVSDSCNLERRGRQTQIKAAQAAGYRVTIVNVHCDPVELARRLVAADDRRAQNGQPRTWWRLVRYIQQPRFQVPHLTEVSSIRHYRSGTRTDTLVLEN